MCIFSKFEIIRKKYFAQYSAKWSDFEILDSETKFLYIMKNHQKILGNFLWNYGNTEKCCCLNSIGYHYCFKFVQYVQHKIINYIFCVCRDIPNTC